MSDVDSGPFDVVLTAWVRLVRASHSVVSAIEKDLKAAGFPPLEWYDVLLELERAPDGERPFALEGRLLVAQYNLSRLVDRLERAGLVEKRRCPVDRRGYELMITESGRKLRGEMWPAYAAAIQQHLGAHLQGGEAEMLSAILERLIGGCPSRPQRNPQPCST